jgi:hypothetical protein
VRRTASRFWSSLLTNKIRYGSVKSFRTGRLERELQMVQLSATGCSCIAILWVSLVRFPAITLCFASKRVFLVYFVIDLVRKLYGSTSYICICSKGISAKSQRYCHCYFLMIGLYTGRFRLEGSKTTDFVEPIKNVNHAEH